MVDITALRGATFPADAVRDEVNVNSLRIELVHYVPGRLRLRSAAIKGSAAATENLRRRLVRINGVASASANPYTGSLLLKYDPTRTDLGEITKAIESLGFGVSAPEDTNGATASSVDTLISAVGNKLLGIAAERLLYRIFAVLA